MKRRLIGIDPSKNGFCIVSYDWDYTYPVQLTNDDLNVFFLNMKKVGKYPFYMQVTQEINRLYSVGYPVIAAIEDYSTRSRTQSAQKYALGGVGEISRMACYSAARDYSHEFILYEPTPLEVKKLTTGNAKADKEKVQEHIENDYSIFFKGKKVDDMYDAFAIAKVAETIYNLKENNIVRDRFVYEIAKRF